MTRQRLSFRPLGVVKDVPPESVSPDFYTGAVNVGFGEESARRVRGYLPIGGTPLYDPIKLHWLDDERGQLWFYANGAGVGVWDGGTHTDITPVNWNAGGNDDGFIWTELNGIPVLNRDDPGSGVTPESGWYWDPGQVGIGPMQPLPDWQPAHANSMRAFKNFLVAINLKNTLLYGDAPQSVAWSDAAAPGGIPATWTPAPDNLAGDLQFSSTPGELVDALPLRDSLIVYKRTSAFIMQFVGGQFVFSQRKLFTSTGMLTRDCAAEWQGKHYVLGDGDVYVHDGNQAQSVADSVVRREIFDNMSSVWGYRSFVRHSSAAHEILFFFPTGAAGAYCDIAAVWNYRDNRWSFREFLGREFSDAKEGLFFYDNSPDWDTDSQAWDSDVNPWFSTGETPTVDRIVGAEPGASKLQGFGLSNDDDGQSITGALVWGGKDFGAPDRIKYISRIWPRCTADNNEVLQFRLGSQFHFGEAVDFTPWRDFTVNVDDKLDFEKQGRLLTMEVKSEGGGVWELHGFDLEVSEAGKF